MVPFKERRSGGDRRSGKDRRNAPRATPGTRSEESQGRGAPKVQLRKDLSDVWNTKGKELLRQNDYDHAMQAFDMAVKIKPNHAEACYNLASVCSFKGDIEGALSMLQRAIEIEPSFKEKAKINRYFKKLKDNSEFKKLIH